MFHDFNHDPHKLCGTAYALVVVGRFFGGVGGGAATVGVPMFLGEVAPKHLRGMFGACTQLVLVTGILVAEVRANADVLVLGDPHLATTTLWASLRSCMS